MAPVYESDAAKAHSGQSKDSSYSNKRYSQERSGNGRTFERGGSVMTIGVKAVDASSKATMSGVLFLAV